MDLKEQIIERFDRKDFLFDENSHKYTLGGVPYISVTTLIQQFSKPFNTNYWSKRKADERGVTQEVILNEWKEKNKHSNILGTTIHYWIEQYFKQIYQPLPHDIEMIERINKFNKIYSSDLYKLTPLLFETKVFSKNYSIAGTIDALFTYKDKIVLMDWKTNKEFTDNDTPNAWHENLLPPFNKYYKNHLTEYSMQLSLYSIILEEWGFKVSSCYLCHFPPNGDAKIHKIIDMRKEMKSFLENSDLKITIEK